MQSYKHLTLSERESLYQMRKAGRSIREIGKELGRSPLSISRELKHNVDSDGRYNVWNATIAYLQRRKACKRKHRFAQDTALKRWVIEKLEQYWPPEAIVGVWKKEHTGARLSHASIYRAIRRGELPGIAEPTHLRRRGKLKYKAHSSCAAVKVDRRIREWPVEVAARARMGDWEGDTLRGAQGQGQLVTLVDRKSRFLVAGLCRDRRAETVKNRILSLMKGKPVLTMSFDNGAEFSQYHEIEQALHTTVYFADPHSPWQRGSNENLNGLLRFFFPKGMDFRRISHRHLASVVDLLNDRPRKCLGWLSPKEVFFSKCCT